jgi:hypothetical protein
MAPRIFSNDRANNDRANAVGDAVRPLAAALDIDLTRDQIA